jgi:hypothetical protein
MYPRNRIFVKIIHVLTTKHSSEYQLPKLFHELFNKNNTPFTKFDDYITGKK